MVFHNIFFLLKLFISGALIFFVLHKFDFSFLLISFKNINITFFTIAFVLFGFQLILASLRWFQINQALKIGLSFKKTLIISLISQFFSQILPTTFGGDAIKILALSKSRLPIKKCISSIFFDRLIGLFVLLIYIFLGLLKISGDSSTGFQTVITYFILIITFIILLVIVYKRFFRRLILVNNIYFFFRAKFNQYFSNFLNIKKAKNILFIASLIHLINIFVFYFISLSIYSHVTLLDCFIYIPVITLISMIPISFAGWGVRETSFLFVFGYVGINNSHGITISVLFGILNIMWALPGFIIIILKRVGFDNAQ